MNADHNLNKPDYGSLARQIKVWASELGFQQLGITDTLMDEHEARLTEWLGYGYHGEMDYMERHGSKRSRPARTPHGSPRTARYHLRPYPARRRSWHTGAAITGWRTCRTSRHISA